MKILITTDTYFPMINGVVVSTNNLYKELKNHGHDVKIMTLSHTEDEKVEGDIYYLKSIKVNIYPDARIKVPFYNKLVKEIINWRPDVVHSQTEFSTMMVAKYIVNKLNIPQLHTYHTMYEDYLNYLFGGRILKRSTAAKITKLLLNTFNGVIAPTDKTKEVLIKYGVNSDIHTIPTGIDLSRFQREITNAEKIKLLSKLGLRREDKIMVYVGRIAEEKNITEIISLFPKVMHKVKNAKLLIVGGGPELQFLKHQVTEKNLDTHIIFTGMVQPDEVYKYYNLGDIFVTASTSETQGLTYLEALSSGCPVVCKYDNCVEDVIIQGQNGFSYRNDWEFCEYASEILLNKDLREKMSIEAQCKAKEYSSVTFANRIFDVYDKVINCPTLVHTEVRASGVQY